MIHDMLMTKHTIFYMNYRESVTSHQSVVIWMLFQLSRCRLNESVRLVERRCSIESPSIAYLSESSTRRTCAEWICIRFVRSICNHLSLIAYDSFAIGSHFCFQRKTWTLMLLLAALSSLSLKIPFQSPTRWFIQALWATLCT